MRNTRRWTCGRALKGRSEPYGACGQTDGQRCRVDHSLTTLSDLSPTGSTAITTTGFYILFFNPIVLTQGSTSWRIALAGDRFRVWGYMYKRDTFHKDQIVDLKEFKVRPRFWTSILTALTWEKGTNYRIILDDGREYYLSSNIWEFEELKALLEGLIQENRTKPKEA